MLGTRPFRLARVRLIRLRLIQPVIATLGPLHRAARATIDKHASYCLASTQSQGFVGDLLEGQRFAAAHLFVGGDERHRSDVDQAVIERLRRETTENRGMDRANAGARLHRHDAFHGHVQVDHNAIGLVDPGALQRFRLPADAMQKIFIRYVADGPVVRFEMIALAAPRPSWTWRSRQLYEEFSSPSSNHR